MRTKHIRWWGFLYFWGIFAVLAVTGGLSSPKEALASETKVVTLIHTNDLHSHFRPDKSVLQLGGIARIKTAVDQIRKNKAALLVDGGDWSEGNIYYTAGTGAETIKMMDRVGYDVAVVGNHDFLNGPDVLMKSLIEAKPKMSFILNNIGLDHYSEAKKFRSLIPPYVIKEIEGKKIAFIGLTTFELIYDKFYRPIEVKEPFLGTGALAESLKKQVDAVVVISHNSIWANQWILKAAPAVDLIIGAHDHVKIDRAIEVKRNGANSGWIVETGCWGRYLGQVDLEISSSGVLLKNYKLTQMDLTVPEDPEILSEIGKLERKIEAKFGSDFFSKTITQNTLDLHHSGEQNLIGNFVTDAFVKETGADFSMESNHAIYGDLYPGEVKAVDLYNVYPAIFNPATEKSWTLKKLPMKGRTLKRLLTVMNASNKLRSLGGISVSGLEFKVDPVFLAALNSTLDPNLFGTDLEHSQLPQELFTLNRPLTERDVQSILKFPIIQDLKIRGQEFDPNETYTLVTGGMVITAFEYINSWFPVISMDGLEDTGLETWRAISSYAQKNNPIHSGTVKIGGRVQTVYSDLGIYEGDLGWKTVQKTSSGTQGLLQVRISNYGSTASEAGQYQASEDPASPTIRGASLQILSNPSGIDFGQPVLTPLVKAIPIPAIESGQSWTYETQVTIPEVNLGRNQTPVLPVQIKLNDSSGNRGPTNKEITRFLSAL